MTLYLVRNNAGLYLLQNSKYGILTWATNDYVNTYHSYTDAEDAGRSAVGWVDNAKDLFTVETWVARKQV
jgi:hypothetical protein